MAGHVEPCFASWAWDKHAHQRQEQRSVPFGRCRQGQTSQKEEHGEEEKNNKQEKENHQEENHPQEQEKNKQEENDRQEENQRKEKNPQEKDQGQKEQEKNKQQKEVSGCCFVVCVGVFSFKPQVFVNTTKKNNKSDGL